MFILFEVRSFKRINILDNFKSLFFCFHSFSVRRTIDVLDKENQPVSGKIRTVSGALGITYRGRLTPKV